MKDATRDVAEFFGKIADTYGDKYERSDAFHHYFFNERLEEAVRGHDFAERSVLDVGAGTGPLYDRIVGEFPSVNYYAVDISTEMLAASQIPPDRRFVGALDDVALPVPEFDFVYLLGVTTYISDEDLRGTLKRVHSLLSVSGRVVITITNRTSADWILRRLLRTLPGIRGRKRFVLSQDFPTYARSMQEFRKLVNGYFAVEKAVGLNHTVFPFNQLIKRPSVSVAKRIHSLSEGAAKHMFSSDILVELVKI